MIKKAVPVRTDGKKNCVLFQFKNLLKHKKMNLMQYQDEMHQLNLEFV